MSVTYATESASVLTVGALIAWMYAVGTLAKASSNSPAIPHFWLTEDSSDPAKTILTVCIVMMMLTAAAISPSPRKLAIPLTDLGNRNDPAECHLLAVPPSGIAEADSRRAPEQQTVLRQKIYRAFPYTAQRLHLADHVPVRDVLSDMQLPHAPEHGKGRW